jgi:ribose transport system substrate-binding protein
MRLQTRVRLGGIALLASSLVLAGCGGGSDEEDTAAAPAAASEEPAPSEAGEPAEGTDGVEPGSGEGLKIGYISLGDSIPFVKLVSDDIKKQAEAAGAELLFCDAQLDAAKALECARTFKTQAVDGIINFQLDEKAAPQICAAGPDVPVVAVDIHQAPCEAVFMGADNQRAGEMAGTAMGEYFKESFDCEYDAYVSLEQPAAGAVNEARAGGAITGFEGVCGPVPQDKLRRVDAGGTIDGGREKFADTLTALGGAERIVVTSLNDDMLLGAFAAAKSQNRQDQIFGAAQGADPSAHTEIQDNPNWIGDTAYFPERYGTIAVPAIIQLINGEEVPKEAFVDHVFIDKDNFGEFYG